MGSDDPRDITSSRFFAASPDRLFAAFADPTELAVWWGPAGFTNEFEEFDFRVGGAWRFTMRSPDGATYPNGKQFTAIEPPHRIAFVHLQPMHLFTMTLAFEAEGSGTRVTWHMRFEVPESEAVRAFIAQANEQNFDRLAAHLAG